MALLLNLMEQEIDDIIGGRLKCGVATSRSPGFRAIPGQYICPADQIEPTSHLGHAMNQRSQMLAVPDDGPPGGESLDSSDFSHLLSDGSVASEDERHDLTRNTSLRWHWSQEKNRHSRPKQKLILKPVAPTKYSGEPNSE